VPHDCTQSRHTGAPWLALSKAPNHSTDLLLVDTDVTYRAEGTRLGALGGSVLIVVAIVIEVALVTGGKPLAALSVGPVIIIAVAVGLRLMSCLIGIRVTRSGLIVARIVGHPHYEWQEVDRIDIKKQSKWWSRTDESGNDVAVLVLTRGAVIKLRGLRTPWRDEPDYGLIHDINELILVHKTSAVRRLSPPTG
jgi:hypothetical protein